MCPDNLGRSPTNGFQRCHDAWYRLSGQAGITENSEVLQETTYGFQHTGYCMDDSIIKNYTDWQRGYLWIVTNEVAKQVDFALDSWNCFTEKMNANDFVKASADIQHMLNHTAIIANLIKPDVKNIRARNRSVNGLTIKCKDQARHVVSILRGQRLGN